MAVAAASSKTRKPANSTVSSPDRADLSNSLNNVPGVSWVCRFGKRQERPTDVDWRRTLVRFENISSGGRGLFPDGAAGNLPISASSPVLQL